MMGACMIGKALLWSALVVFGALVVVAVFFVPRDYRFLSKSSVEAVSVPLRVALRPLLERIGDRRLPDDRPLDLLLAGVPGAGNPAPYLTDTVMLLRLDAARGTLTVISLPRDLLVELPIAGGGFTRLNSVYERGERVREGLGVALLQRTVENVTGVHPAHYAVVDLELVREAVDALGGVNVYVEETIFDPLFPGANFSHQLFTLEKGWRYLDGETATKFVRTRHSARGDFWRMRHQQQLVEAVKQKITGLSLIWDLPLFVEIFQAIKRHVRTDLDMGELSELFSVAKSLRPENIRTVLLDADPERNLLATDQFWFGAERASIVRPVAGIGEYRDIRAYVESIFRDSGRPRR